MKSRVVDIEKEYIPEYPVLMKLKDDDLVVVMFSDIAAGVVVYSEKPEIRVGTYSHNRVIDRYEIFDGTIELSN